MKRIVWCSLPVSIFAGFFIYSIKMAIDDAPVIGWIDGVRWGVVKGLE